MRWEREGGVEEGRRRTTARIVLRYDASDGVTRQTAGLEGIVWLNLATKRMLPLQSHRIYKVKNANGMRTRSLRCGIRWSKGTNKKMWPHIASTVRILVCMSSTNDIRFHCVHPARMSDLRIPHVLVSTRWYGIRARLKGLEIEARTARTCGGSRLK